MPNYVVTGPDGRQYRITAPEGATQDEVLAYVQANAGGGQSLVPPRPAAKPRSSAPVEPKSVTQNLMAGVNRGIANTVGFIPDAIGSALNAVLPQSLQGQPGFYSRAVERGLNALGADTKPDAGSTAGTVGEFAGAGLIGGVPFRGAQIASSGLRGLLGAAKTEAGLGAISGLAYEGARDLTSEDSLLPVAASIFAPYTAQGGAAAIRSLARGPGSSNAIAMQDNIRRFVGETGAQPTVAQATGKSPQLYLEKGLAFVPGASPAVIMKGKQQQSEFGRRLARIAQEVRGNKSGLDDFEAGILIQRGINDAVSEFKSAANVKYADADALIPPETVVKPTATLSRLKDILSDLSDKDLQELANKDSRLYDWLTTLSSRAESGLTYGDLAKLRSAAGRNINVNELHTGAPKSDWKRLYGAITDDLMRSADELDPSGAAGAAQREAAAFWKQGINEIDDYLQPIANRTEPIQVWAAFKRDAPTAINQMQALKSRMGQNRWPQLQAKFLEDLGMVPAGKQTSDVMFSSERFLTSWNKLGKRGQEILVDNATVRQNLNDMVKHFEDLRRGSQLLYNTSGTAGSGLFGAALWQALGAAASFNVFGLAKTAAAFGGGYGFAKAMMSPKFANWLARSSKLPIEKAPGAIAKLSALQLTNPEEVAFRDALVSQLRNALQGAQEGQ